MITTWQVLLSETHLKFMIISVPLKWDTNEIVYSLIAPLEEMGYTLPDKLVPDISEGKVFCNWLRKERNIDPSTFPTYTHEYGDGRKIPNVKLYPNELLPDFREHFNNEWLLQRAEQYFSKKDIKAIPYLQKKWYFNYQKLRNVK